MDGGGAAGEFRTRVFPIVPGEGRTIRLRFGTPLDPERGYVLPLGDGAADGRLRLDLTATRLARAPALALRSAAENAGRATARAIISPPNAAMSAFAARFRTGARSGSTSNSCPIPGARSG